MDIEQTVIFRVGEMMEVFHLILRKLDEEGARMSPTNVARLVSFELLASPEMLEYNSVLKTTNGLLYTHQDMTPACRKKGFFVLRAPLLPLVTMLLDRHPGDWDHAETTRAILSEFPQKECCWFNVNKKKACACASTSIETQRRHQAYVFCHKHWSPVLRQEREEQSVMYPSSETNLDDWLETIV
jgi:hypothetical protein